MAGIFPKGLDQWLSAGASEPQGLDAWLASHAVDRPIAPLDERINAFLASDPLDFDPQSAAAVPGVAKVLDFAFGDKPATGDEIVPTDSPIDYITSAAAARLTGAMVKDAGAVIGNEIGAVGRDVTDSKANKLMQRAITEDQVARAEAQGFDINNTYYHGTRANFESFDPDRAPVNGQVYGKGTYVSTNPKKAGMWASNNTEGSEITQGANVIPVQLNVKNTFDLSAPLDKKLMQRAIDEGILEKGTKIPSTKFENDRFFSELQKVLSPDKLTKFLQESGYDSLQNPYGESMVIFDPKNIRSKFAEFNPKNAGKAGLSLGLAGVAANSNKEK